MGSKEVWVVSELRRPFLSLGRATFRSWPFRRSCRFNVKARQPTQMGCSRAYNENRNLKRRLGGLFFALAVAKPVSTVHPFHKTPEHSFGRYSGGSFGRCKAVINKGL